MTRVVVGWRLVWWYWVDEQALLGSDLGCEVLVFQEQCDGGSVLVEVGNVRVLP